MGPPKFRKSCWDKGRYKLPLGLEYTSVETWRTTHPFVKKYWYAVEKAAKQAILNPGQVITLKPTPLAPEVAFSVKLIGGISFLLIRLPSGRKLAYPRPRIAASKKFDGGGQAIVFLGKIGQTANWGDNETWGGTLVENITQAVAADIMAHGAHQAERAGYEIATLIHDQALAYYQEWQSSEEFVRLLTDLPSWAVGLPIEAEGDLVPFYRKG